MGLSALGIMTFLRRPPVKAAAYLGDVIAKLELLLKVFD